jgi:hypothetical protein
MFQYRSVEAPLAANEAGGFHDVLHIGGYAVHSARLRLTLRQPCVHCLSVATRLGLQLRLCLLNVDVRCGVKAAADVGFCAVEVFVDARGRQSYCVSRTACQMALGYLI